MAELVKNFLVIFRNGGVNIFVTVKFLFGSYGSHVFSFVVINSRSSASSLNIQYLSPLYSEFRSDKIK